MAQSNVATKAKNLQFVSWLVNTEPEVLENCLIRFQETLGYPDKENFKRTLESLSRSTYVIVTQMSILNSSSLRKDERIKGKLPEVGKRRKDHRTNKICNTSELNNNELAVERKKKQYAALRRRRLLKKDRLHKKMIDLFGSTSPTPTTKDLKNLVSSYESQLPVNTSRFDDDKFETTLEVEVPTTLANENISKISCVINNGALSYANDSTNEETRHRSSSEKHITPIVNSNSSSEPVQNELAVSCISEITRQEFEGSSVEKIYEISRKASDNLTSEIIFESDDEYKDEHEEQQEFEFEVDKDINLCTNDANITGEVNEPNKSTSCSKKTVKFPRIKVTTHREVRKFPGKMESIKKNQRDNKISYPRMKITSHREVKRFSGKMASMKKAQSEDKTAYSRMKVTQHEPVQKFPGKMDAMKTVMTTNKTDDQNNHPKIAALATNTSVLCMEQNNSELIKKVTNNQDFENNAFDVRLKKTANTLKTLLDIMYGDYEMCKPHVSNDKENTQVVKIIACRTMKANNKKKNLSKSLLAHFQDDQFICHLKKILLENFETVHPMFEVFFDKTVEIFKFLIKRNSQFKPDQDVGNTKLDCESRNLHTENDRTTHNELKNCDQNDLNKELVISNTQQVEASNVEAPFLRCKNLKELLNTETVNNPAESQSNLTKEIEPNFENRRSNMFFHSNTVADITMDQQNFVSTEISETYNLSFSNNQKENINHNSSIKSTTNDNRFQSEYINYMTSPPITRTQIQKELCGTRNVTSNNLIPQQSNSSVINYSVSREPQTVSQAYCGDYGNNPNHLYPNFSNVGRNNTINMVNPDQTNATNGLNENWYQPNYELMQTDGLISSTGTEASWAGATSKQQGAFLGVHNSQKRSMSLTYPQIAPSGIHMGSNTSVSSDKGCNSSNQRRSKVDVRCETYGHAAANANYSSINPHSSSTCLNNMPNQHSTCTHNALLSHRNTHQPIRENIGQTRLRDHPEKARNTSIQQVTEAQHVKKQCLELNRNNNQSAAFAAHSVFNTSQNQPGNALPFRDYQEIYQGQRAIRPSNNTCPLTVNQTQSMLNASYLQFSNQTSQNQEKFSGSGLDSSLRNSTNCANKLLVSNRISKNSSNSQPNIPAQAPNQSYQQTYQATLQRGDVQVTPVINLPGSSPRAPTLEALLYGESSRSAKKQCRVPLEAKKLHQQSVNVNSRMGQNFGELTVSFTSNPQAISSSCQMRPNPPPCVNVACPPDPQAISSSCHVRPNPPPYVNVACPPDPQAISSSCHVQSNPRAHANYFQIQQSNSQKVFLPPGTTIEENVCYPNKQNTQLLRQSPIACSGHDNSLSSVNMYQNTNNKDMNSIQRERYRERNPVFEYSRSNSLPSPVFNNTPWHQEENPRSSMSRDSGIFSPTDIVENNATQPDLMAGREEMGDSSGIGVISFVTSENPSAQRTERSSPCSHCAKPTVLKCSQCLGVFYCSSACQMAQWRYHGPVCVSPLS